ncbi:MAG: sodium:proton antiporter [Halanaerobiales bacterium]
MRILLEKLLINYPFFFAIILFVMGAFTVLTRSNLFKKLIGINIMEGGIFLFFVAAGNIKGGAVPILVDNPGVTYINPLTSALMLTGIVVSVSVTAFALALIVRIYKIYGTTDARRIAEMRKEVKERCQQS